MVLIPHPNELNTLSVLQKAALRSLQSRYAAENAVFAPFAPLFVFFNDELLCGQGAAVTAKSCPISACTLTGLYMRAESLVLSATLTTPEKTIPGSVLLARRLGSAQSVLDALSESEMQSPAFDDFAFIADAANVALPLNLPVFRVAQADFTLTEASVQWSIAESSWRKQKR